MLARYAIRRSVTMRVAALAAVFPRMYSAATLRSPKEIAADLKRLKKEAAASAQAQKKARLQEALLRKKAQRERALLRKKAQRERALLRKKAFLAKRKELMVIRAARIQARRERLQKLKAKRQALRAARLARAAEAKQRLIAQKAEQENAQARRALIERPWKKLGKLTTNPQSLYIKEKYATISRLPNEKPFDVLLRVRAEYKSLTPEQRAPYEAKAAANRKARKEARNKLQGLRATAFATFIKENFSAVSSQAGEGTNKEKISKTARLLAAKWKGLSAQERAVYKKKADVMRAQASKNLQSLMSSQ